MASRSSERNTSLDALRGLVMVIMALDHVRDFFHADAMLFQPENLSRTTAVLFFTRWVTHICAPTFVFTAGAGAYLRLQRDGNKPRLSGYLVTRGLWLIAIELIVMRVALNFSVSTEYPLLLLILWALGSSMIALAALIYVPIPMLVGMSMLVLVLHNTFDTVRPSQFGMFGPVWQALHQPGAFLINGFPIVVGYPVLPWIALMAVGFCFGPLLSRPAAERQAIYLRTAMALLGAFIVVRALNVYGDPSPWSVQPTSPLTVLSFLNVTKYPPSLSFLALTIGAAMLVLYVLDRQSLSSRQPLVLIGRVPLFFYVVHFWFIHVLVVIAAYLRYGSHSLAFLFSPLPSMGGQRSLFPPGFGYPLWVTYLVWIGVLLVMFPLCRWFGDLKFSRRRWWAGYL